VEWVYEQTPSFTHTLQRSFGVWGDVTLVVHVRDGVVIDVSSQKDQVESGSGGGGAVKKRESLLVEAVRSAVVGLKYDFRGIGLSLELGLVDKEAGSGRGMMSVPERERDEFREVVEWVLNEISHR
jgi:hypothetical protein